VEAGGVHGLTDGDGRPVVLAVDSDAAALARIVDELERYERDYRVVCLPSTDEALTQLEALREQGARVAVVLAARCSGALLGEDLLARVATLHPHAKCGLLIEFGGWGDEDTTRAIRAAMAQGHIDYYVLKPWTEPDELFHRTVTEFLHEWRRANVVGRRELTVVAERWSPRGYELRNMLARNGVPHAFHASDTEEGRRILESCGSAGSTEPVVLGPDGRVYMNPSIQELATHAFRVPTELGEDDDGIFDVAIVGAGPAGLAAAVYASSEGLRALVVEARSIGGQAGSSARIRNYLGFPRGLTGGELATRAYQQAWVFGTTFLLTQEVTKLELGDGAHVLTAGGEEIEARSVILASGVTWRTLGLPALERFHGRGLFYGYSGADAVALRGGHVFVIGAGNSGGQAAAHLSLFAEDVTIVCRRERITDTMSSYLIEEIEAAGVDVRQSTQIVDAEGDERLQRVTLRHASGEEETLAADAVFALIGAEPNTEWLPAAIERDERGFVLTGGGEHMFETTAPGVFAIGDVRAGSVKRVASAVGEGSVVIQQLHRHLEGLRPASRR
jgi:thioredoxin reductase (NADPH)